MAEIDRILCPIEFFDTSGHAIELAGPFDDGIGPGHRAPCVERASPSTCWAGRGVPGTGVPDELAAFPPLRQEEWPEEVQRFNGAIAGADPMRRRRRRGRQSGSGDSASGRADGRGPPRHGHAWPKRLRGPVSRIDSQEGASQHAGAVLTVPPAVERVETVI